MQIQKNFPLVSVLVSYNKYNKGTIWVNSYDGCILRINNLTFFNNYFDKFNYIDINCDNNNSYIINDEDLNPTHDNDLTNFLILLNQTIINEFNNKEIEKIDYSLINDITSMLKKKI